MRIALVFTLALAIVSCSGSSPSEPGPTNSTFTMRYGDTAAVGGTTFRFSDVTDNRCPTTTTCVWAGDAAVRLDSNTASLVLHTNNGAGPTSGTLGTVTITLIDVAPPRVNLEPPKKEEYVVTLRAQ